MASLFFRLPEVGNAILSVIVRRGVRGISTAFPIGIVEEDKNGARTSTAITTTPTTITTTTTMPDSTLKLTTGNNNNESSNNDSSSGSSTQHNLDNVTQDHFHLRNYELNYQQYLEDVQRRNSVVQSQKSLPSMPNTNSVIVEKVSNNNNSSSNNNNGGNFLPKTAMASRRNAINLQKPPNFATNNNINDSANAKADESNHQQQQSTSASNNNDNAIPDSLPLVTSESLAKQLNVKHRGIVPHAISEVNSPPVPWHDGRSLAALEAVPVPVDEEETVKGEDCQLALGLAGEESGVLKGLLSANAGGGEGGGGGGGGGEEIRGASSEVGSGNGVNISPIEDEMNGMTLRTDEVIPLAALPGSLEKDATSLGGETKGAVGENAVEEEKVTTTEGGGNSNANAGEKAREIGLPANNHVRSASKLLYSFQSPNSHALRLVHDSFHSFSSSSSSSSFFLSFFLSFCLTSLFQYGCTVFPFFANQISIVLFHWTINLLCSSTHSGTNLHSEAVYFRDLCLETIPAFSRGISFRLH
jgi:hypothetical protein